MAKPTSNEPSQTFSDENAFNNRAFIILTFRERRPTAGLKTIAACGCRLLGALDRAADCSHQAELSLVVADDGFEQILACVGHGLNRL